MSTPASSNMLEDFRSSGNALMAVGAISVVAGVLALVYPKITLLAIALITGINILIFSVLRLIDAFSDEMDTTGRVLAGVIGVLGLIAGLVVLRRPGASLLAIVLVLGIWLIVNGTIDFFRAAANLEDRAMRMLVAIVDIVLGVLILALPKLSLGTLAILIGISFIVRGGIALVTGWRMRRTHHPPTFAPA